MSFRAIASHRGQSGFSLLEVLIASTIMGLVITAMVAVVSTVERTDITADQYRQARIFLKQEMENVGRHYSQYAGVAGYTSSNALRLDANPQTGYAGIPASIELVISPGSHTVSGLPVAFKRVWATVTWTDQNQKVRSMSLSKLITELP